MILGALAVSTALSAQNKIDFEEYDLDNGLHVILHEDHSTPIAAVTVLYHVGSKNEDQSVPVLHTSLSTCCSRGVKTSNAVNLTAM